MAKSLYTIQMDFKNANDCAAKLEEASRCLRSAANNKFQSEMNTISQAWTGENANIYVKKCDLLRNQMLSTSSQLMTCANTIRTVAKNTYSAELKARQIALKKGK